MAKECIFCDIVAGKIPSDIVYQDKGLLAFRDISPQAPIHVIIIPKDHIATLAEVSQKQRNIMGNLIILAQELAIKEGIAKSGYRLVVNCGYEGGQVVPHLHFHLLGGRKLSEQLG